MYKTLTVHVLHYAITTFKFEVNQPKHAKVIAIFLSGAKEDEENTKILRQILKAHISVMDGWIRLKFETGVVPI